MIESTSTICALATPPGRGGLAVIRVSGPLAFYICDKLFVGNSTVSGCVSHRILYGWLRVGDTKIDTVTISVFRSPTSYTGEDVAEIGCHGGIFVIDQILQAFIDCGVRLADPGEFTRRAFLNRKLDLTQVEAVADIIDSETRIGAQTAARQLSGGFTKRLSAIREQMLSIIGLLELELDFSEEDVAFVDRERLRQMIQGLLNEVDSLSDYAKSAAVLRSGYHVAVVGFPNAGKSSLFNALLERKRAIVSAVAGTTRDYLHETVIIDGYSIHLLDTAGLRDSEDNVEMQGISLTASVMEEANLILVVNDASVGRGHSTGLYIDLQKAYPQSHFLLVQNKIDLVSSAESDSVDSIACSAHTGAGIDNLRIALLRMVKEYGAKPSDMLVNARQAQLLRNIGSALRSCLNGMDIGLSQEFLAVDLRTSIRLLGEISGETWNPDLLDTVFSRFCIGK